MRTSTSIYKLQQLTSKLATFLIICLFSYNAPAKAQEDTKLIPFFDNENNPVSVAFPVGEQLDISPPAPQLNDFDKAVLNVCGTFGKKVQPNEFKQLLRAYPNVLQKLQQVTRGELRPNRRRRSDFLQDLTNIWFKQKGFEHIFCGEVYNDNDIGGLHFYGRYLQLQNQGIAGRLPNNDARQEVVPGVIYTMGVIVKQGNRTVRDVIKGYGYLSNAEEILIDTTRIFKQQGKTEGACIYQVQDIDTGKTFPSVFVRKEQSIITYYPDATPQGPNCKK
jgi:Bacterial EndoU nuclease